MGLGWHSGLQVPEAYKIPAMGSQECQEKVGSSWSCWSSYYLLNIICLFLVSIILLLFMMSISFQLCLPLCPFVFLSLFLLMSVFFFLLVLVSLLFPLFLFVLFAPYDARYHNHHNDYSCSCAYSCTCCLFCLSCIHVLVVSCVCSSQVCLFLPAPLFLRPVLAGVVRVPAAAAAAAVVVTLVPVCLHPNKHAQPTLV